MSHAGWPDLHSMLLHTHTIPWHLAARGHFEGEKQLCLCARTCTCTVFYCLQLTKVSNQHLEPIYKCPPTSCLPLITSTYVVCIWTLYCRMAICLLPDGRATVHLSDFMTTHCSKNWVLDSQMVTRCFFAYLRVITYDLTLIRAQLPAELWFELIAGGIS